MKITWGVFGCSMLVGIVLAMSAFGDEEAAGGVCKLTTRLRHKSGKVKVQVEEIPAATRGECEQLSREKMVNPDPEEYSSATSSYAFRQKRLP